MHMTPGEHKEIRKALRAVAKAGFHPVKVDDGGDEYITGAKSVMTEKEVLDAVDAVEDATVFFKGTDQLGRVRGAWMRCIMGNAKDGSEVIADNSVTPGFAEALDALIV